MKLTLLTILLSFLVVFVSSELDLAPQSFRDEVVQRHNELRAIHQVGPVEEDIEMSKRAQQSAYYTYLYNISRTECSVMKYYGSNTVELPETSTGREYVDKIYKDYEKPYRENGLYNIEPSGHFTQIIWKNTKKIGIGKVGRFVNIQYYHQEDILGKFKASVLLPIMDQ